MCVTAEPFSKDFDIVSNLIIMNLQHLQNHRSVPYTVVASVRRSHPPSHHIHPSIQWHWASSQYYLLPHFRGITIIDGYLKNSCNSSGQG